MNSTAPSETAVEPSPERKQSVDEEKAALDLDLDLPPDGGKRAWLVVLAIWGLTVAEGGYLIAWGTFQAYYESNILQDSSSSDIAWIGSLQYALDYTPGLLAGRLLDLGYLKPTLVVSAMAMAVANFTVPECTSYYQFLLSQGLLFGLAAGFMYTPCLAIISHWFQKKRPIVYAIITTGSAVGGVIFLIMFRQLEVKIGFKWTMRVFAFMLLFFCTVAVFTVKPRKSTRKETLPKFFDFRGVVSSWAYILYVFATFLAFMALFTPLTFATVKAQALGMSSSLSFYMIAIINASTLIGRLSCGLLANKYGSLNLTIIATLLSVGFILGWAYTETPGPYIALSILYGISSGGYLSLFAVPVAAMGPVQDAGRRTGIQMTILSFGALIGPPISGAIRDKGTDFHGVGLFAAFITLGSAVFMIAAKRLYMGTFIRGVF